MPGDGFGAGCGLAHDFEIVFGADERAESAADEFLVVGERHGSHKEAGFTR